MGTILYIILRLAGYIDEPNDLVYLCFLVAVDQVFWVMLLLLRVLRRRQTAGL